LQSWFDRDALAQATQLKGIEAGEFQERRVLQRPQVARINAIETRDDRAHVEVTGELLRTGLYEGAAFTEVIQFTLRLVFRPNPDLLGNRRQPTVVTEFELAYTHDYGDYSIRTEESTSSDATSRCSWRAASSS